jgi:hypothetical protein
VGKDSNRRQCDYLPHLEDDIEQASGQDKTGHRRGPDYGRLVSGGNDKQGQCKKAGKSASFRADAKRKGHRGHKTEEQGDVAPADSDKVRQSGESKS